MQLELRRWQDTDKEALMAIMNTMDRRFLSDRLPMPYTEQDAAVWLHWVRERQEGQGVFRAVVVDGQVVGMASVEQKEDVYRRDSEISYCLRQDCQGRGIMTAAVAELCKEAFEKLEILRITGQVFAPNTASRRVLEKNGFVQEGCLRRAVLKNGVLQDLCLYGKEKG